MEVEWSIADAGGHLVADRNDDVGQDVVGASTAPFDRVGRLEARSRPGDECGDIVVDAETSREASLDSLAATHRAVTGDTDLRRPVWYARPIEPVASAYRRPG